jgi:hypothetical protein
MTSSGQRMQPGALRRSAVATAIAGVFLAFVLVDATVCPLAGAAGVPCPGCGLGRASLALLHGDFAAAHAAHPLVLLLAPLFAGYGAWLAIEYVRGEALPRPVDAPRVSRVAALIGALMVAVYAARFAGAFGGPATVARWSLGG